MKEGNDMVNVTEVGREEKRRVVRIETGNEEKRRKGIRRMKQTGLKEAEIGMVAEIGEKKATEKIRIEGKV